MDFPVHIIQAEITGSFVDTAVSENITAISISGRIFFKRYKGIVFVEWQQRQTPGGRYEAEAHADVIIGFAPVTMRNPSGIEFAFLYTNVSRLFATQVIMIVLSSSE